MTPEDFAAFYKAVHDYQPFPWQIRLCHQVAEQGWPSVMDLPTASAKTSSIDIAVFTLALQAGKPLHERSAPLRIFFVIDRRLVVDQAAAHANKLKEALEGASEGSIVRQVADALRTFSGTSPLHVATMRGGMYRDDSWVKAPNQPTVCVSTVDQVGSRLLFRGYGVSEYARPVHAALTGNDALYLVDEAHLSQPFLKTLQAVRRYRGGPWAKHSLGGPFDVVEISATAEGEGERFTLQDEDHADPELSKRLNAPKPARLVETTKFEAETAELAGKAQAGDVKVIGIIVNRVASAREIFRRLPGEAFEDKVLLTGRIRPWDRDELLDQCLERMRAGRLRTPEGRPLFVVATMTVEVGADLDFDYLITEAAPLPALRQRFGRLDRLGRFGHAAGAILLRKAKGSDPIYGEDLAKTWEWLREQADSFDFGVNALNDLIRGASKPPPATTPRTAPVLFPAHLDAWVQTSPAPRPSPDVAPFLHGPEALETADVQVVWRGDLHAGQENDWLETVKEAPPRSREAMPLPLVAVKNWLREKMPAEVADIEGVTGQTEATGGSRLALRWYGPEAEGSHPVSANEVRPGDTLVVPSEYGGADAFGWNPQSQEPVFDAGDLCINDMANAAPDDGSKRLIRLRLHDGFETTLMPTSGEENPRPPAKIAHEIKSLLEQGEDADSTVEELLEALTMRPPVSPLMEAVVRQMAATEVRVTVYPAGVILTARMHPGFFRAGAEPLDSEDDSTDVDDTSSLRAGTKPPAQVTLEEHTDGVARWAESFATKLGVPESLCVVLRRAAHLHDLGKADWRFQYLLYGDEPDAVLLAKSGRDWNANQQAVVHKLSGLPKGFRHEFVSVALLHNHTEQLLADMTEDQRRLVNYLVGTHHGRGRPFVPVIKDDAPERVTLCWGGQSLSASSDHGLWRLDSRWTDQFWQLIRQYGFWGLAFLETLLRLADGARSAEEQRQGRESS